jgi:hypothetical protein
MADTQPKQGAKGLSGPAALPSNISVHDFTEAVFTGVLRAIDARQIKLPGSITYGITYNPASGKAETTEPK